jgi:ribokinase
MSKVLVVGGSNTDLVCRSPRLPVAGETLTGSSFNVFAGGKGANQAVAAARSGALVTFCGAVGDDDFGRQRLADLKLDEIDVSCVEVVEGTSSGVALIVVDDAGENQIVVVSGANGRVSPTTVDRAIDSSAWDALLIVLENPADTTRHAIARMKGRAPVVLNAAPFDPWVTDVLPDVDILVCNEVEASGLLGRQVGADTALADVVALRHLGCRSAVITLGPHGAYVADSSGSWHNPALAVEVVDTTGAGDALCGAIAAWLAEGASLREAVAAGVAAGSLAVTRSGAQPSLPRRAEIDRFLCAASQ